MKARVPILLLLATLPPSICPAETNVQARFERSVKDAKSVTNFEVVWRDYLYQPGPASAGPAATNPPHLSRTLEYSYIVFGGKHLALCKAIESNQTNSLTLFESSFDGSNYNTYYGDRRYFVTGATPPNDTAESSFSPLIVPFMFLTKQSDACPTCRFRFSDFTAANADDKLVPTATEVSNGVIVISMAGLTNRDQPTTWKAFLDVEGDAFTPKEITYSEPGNMELITKLAEYTNVGAYRIPASIDWIMRRPGATGTEIATGTVTMVSAQILDKVDDAVFSLGEEKKAANVIWGRGENQFIKQGPQIAPPLSRTIAFMVVRIILIAAVLVLAVILGWKRRTEMMKKN